MSWRKLYIGIAVEEIKEVRVFAMEFRSSKQKCHDANYTIEHSEYLRSWKSLMSWQYARIFFLRYFSVSALTHLYMFGLPATRGVIVIMEYLWRFAIQNGWNI